MQEKLKNKQIAIYCDFDGTIAKSDVADLLLEKLADPQWTVIEERWLRGEIDDCVCMKEQFELIRGHWSDFAEVLGTIELDPHFNPFVSQCRNNNIPLFIGSNGLDKAIDYFLNREKIKVDGIWSYKLVQSNGGWSLTFPQGEIRKNCLVPQAAACKCVLLDKGVETNLYRIVIGDSKSDFCWAKKANLVFAKPKLAEYCREQNIDHIEFSSFADIQEYLSEMLLS